MIDTITIRLNNKFFNQFFSPSTIYNNLTSIKKELATNQEGCEFVGYLKNLFVEVKGDRLTVSGSFAKYVYGSNLISLSKEELIQAVTEVSQILGASLWRGDLIRIDYAKDISVDYDPKYYLSNFISSNEYRIIPHKGSITLNKIRGLENLVICIYDKTRESKKNARDVFKYLSEQGTDLTKLLRFEVRAKYPIAPLLGFSQKRLPAVYLMSDILYERLEHNFYREMGKISIDKSISVCDHNFTTPKEFFDIHAINSILNEGLKENENFLAKKRENGEISSKVKCLILKRSRELANKYGSIVYENYHQEIFAKLNELKGKFQTQIFNSLS